MMVGVYDDLRGLSAPAKVAGQVLATSLLILAGVQLLFFWWPGLGILPLSGCRGGHDRAVDPPDDHRGEPHRRGSTDPLAAGWWPSPPGLSSSTPSSPAPPSIRTSPASLLSVVVAGAAIGFLPYKLPGVFARDSGGMLLGLLLAAATISGVGRTDARAPIWRPGHPGDHPAAGAGGPTPMWCSPSSGGFAGAGRSTRRTRSIHHRLLEIGHSHRTSVLLVSVERAPGLGRPGHHVRPQHGLAVGMLIVVAAVLLGASLPRMLRRAPARRPARIVRPGHSFPRPLPV